MSYHMIYTLVHDSSDRQTIGQKDVQSDPVALPEIPVSAADRSVQHKKQLSRLALLCASLGGSESNTSPLRDGLFSL